MMYYNKKTGELSSTPPWGTAFLLEQVKSVRYPEWSLVDDVFKPPEKKETPKLAAAAVDDSLADLAAAVIDLYDKMEEGKKHDAL